MSITSPKISRMSYLTDTRSPRTRMFEQGSTSIDTKNVFQKFHLRGVMIRLLNRVILPLMVMFMGTGSMVMQAWAGPLSESLLRGS